jgi:hypothetical protein
MTIESSIILPKEPSLENTDMRRLKWLVYGPPGVGKSTFFAGATDVLFLSTDGGMRFIKSMHRPIDSWQTFKKYVRAIQTEKPNQFKAICIDVVDALMRMCIKSTCEKRNIQHQSDEGYGKAYDISTAEFETELEKLVGMGKYGLFLTSHSKDKERKTRFSTISRLEPTLSNQAYKIIYPIMDIVAYLGFDTAGPDTEMGRRIYFQPTESMEAKDRTTRLPESLFLPKPEDSNGFELVENYLLGGTTSRPQQRIQTKKKIIIKSGK